MHSSIHFHSCSWHTEVEDFDESSSFIGEEEGGSAGGFLFDGVASDLGEAVEDLAHVTEMKGDVDFEVAVEGKHDVGPSESIEEVGQERDLMGRAGVHANPSGEPDSKGFATGALSQTQR